MAEEINGVCTFKTKGVCNCDNQGGEGMGTATSPQSTESIEGVGAD